METYEKMKDISIDLNNVDREMFLIEQEDVNKCFFNDDDIKSHVIFINSCQLPHYKYFVYFCELENMMDFYNCLGNQPLKIIFSKNFNLTKDFVDKTIINNIDIKRNYYINKNELYLDSNEIEFNTEDNGISIVESDFDSETDYSTDSDDDLFKEVEKKLRLNEVNLTTK
tara:strand:- start:48 stop:557 length:510 start_codon:yes stop_codon:yes gene_type:complete